MGECAVLLRADEEGLRVNLREIPERRLTEPFCERIVFYTL